VHVKNHIGHLPISGITPIHVDKLKNSLLKPVSPATALKILSVCRAIVNYAVRTGQWSGVNPFGRDRLIMPRPQNKGERFLTPQEARDLLNALELKSPQLRDMAWLSLKTGLRSTEIFSLTGSDVDMVGGVLWVTEKGGRRIALRVEKDVLNLLSGYQRHAGEYIFKSRNNGKLKQISDSFERACIELNLMPGDKGERERMDKRKKVWFHTLRHSFASWLAQSGTVTLLELRDIMRHNSITMTERYAHLIPGKSLEKTSIITDLLQGREE
jgi:integrase